MIEPIRYWNRKLSRIETEKVYGSRTMDLLYGSKLGLRLTDKYLTNSTISRLYGLYQSSKWSRKSILPFIENFQIPMEEFESGPFASFNDFFIRRFKPGMRNFDTNLDILPAFAEARYMAFAKTNDQSLAMVKGISLSPLSLRSCKHGQYGGYRSHSIWVW